MPKQVKIIIGYAPKDWKKRFGFAVWTFDARQYLDIPVVRYKNEIGKDSVKVSVTVRQCPNKIR